MPTYLFNEDKKFYRRRSPQAYAEHVVIGIVVLLVVALAVYLVSAVVIR